MPQRNFICILLVALTSLVCFERRDRSPFGRHFSDVIDKIDHMALLEISQQELFNAAIYGIIEKLHAEGDEHSGFYPLDGVDEFNQELRSEIAGVGIRIDTHPKLKQPIIIDLIYDSPAYETWTATGSTGMGVCICSSAAAACSQLFRWQAKTPTGSSPLATSARTPPRAIPPWKRWWPLAKT